MNSSLYYPELCHFGQVCGCGIIMQNILKIKKKGLFMLGWYPLNSIIPYLKSKNYEDIYKIEYLKYNVPQPWTVTHTLYDFGFHHDYTIQENKIINYDKVKRRFDEKIKNFKDTLNNNDLTIFITMDLPCTDVIINTINWLEENKPNFHLVLMDIYNKPVDASIISEKVSLIRLEKYCDFWTNLFSLKSKEFFEEIYVKFLNALHQKNIKHNYPKFEDSCYRLDFESINKFWPIN